MVGLGYPCNVRLSRSDAGGTSYCHQRHVGEFVVHVSRLKRSLESFSPESLRDERAHDVFAELFFLQKLECSQRWAWISVVYQRGSICHSTDNILQIADIFCLTEVVQILQVCHELFVVEQLLLGQVVEISRICKHLHEL